MKYKLVLLFLLVVLIGSFQYSVSSKKTSNSFNDSAFTYKSVELDGKVYKTVIIGNQEWMAEDLEVTKYNNGDSIELIKCDKIFEKQESVAWNSTRKGAYTIIYKPTRDCFVKNGRTSLIQYNWHAVNDKRGLAPKGWHIPSKQEWEVLINYLGGTSNAGYMMKSTLGWDEKYAINGNNVSGFNALPTGFRNEYGYHMGYSQQAWYWASDSLPGKYTANSLLIGSQGENNKSAIIFKTDWKQSGLSIRCVKD